MDLFGSLQTETTKPAATVLALIFVKSQEPLQRIS